MFTSSPPPPKTKGNERIHNTEAQLVSILRASYRKLLIQTSLLAWCLAENSTPILILWLALFCFIFVGRTAESNSIQWILLLVTLSTDVTLCEEAFFRFAVPTKIIPNWLSVLVDSLPGTKVNAESVERIKRRHSSQEQTFQLLKLWKHQNRDQEMVKKIIQGTSSWNKQVNGWSKEPSCHKIGSRLFVYCLCSRASVFLLQLSWYWQFLTNWKCRHNSCYSWEWFCSNRCSNWKKGYAFYM